MEGECDDICKIGDSLVSTLLTGLQYVEDSFLPECPEASDRPLQEEEFIDFKNKCESNLSSLLNCLNRREYKECLDEHSNVPVKTRLKFVSSVIVLCGQHSETSLWTTQSSQNLTRIILKSLLEIRNFANLGALLIHNKEEIFRQVLSRLRPWLLASTWKHYPAAALCYSWVLQHVQIPHLGEHLNIILPTALIITDDFVIENRITGIRCLEHIVNNVTKTELSWFGQDKVIYEALQPSLYKKEAELIGPLFSALIALLEKMHCQTLHSNLQWTEYDDILGIVLSSMYLEQRIGIRNAYIQVLPSFIRSMGLTVTRHLSRILEVLEEYVLEPSTSLLTVKALDELLCVGWPRMRTHGQRLVVVLLKALRDATEKGSYHPEGTVPALKATLCYVTQLCPLTVQEISSDRAKLNFNPKFEQILDQVLEQPS